MSTTTDDKRKQKGMPLPVIIIAAQLLVVLALWIAEPYLRSHMEVDKTELEKRLEEVEKRSQERKKKEEAERKKKKVSKKDVEKLKKEARKKHERKIRERIDEMNKIRKELKVEKREKLELSKEQDIQNALEEAQEQLQKDIAKLQKRAEDINRKSNDEHADQLEKETGELKDLADAMQEQQQQGQEPDMQAMQESANEAESIAQNLQERQKAVQQNPNKRNEIGRQHHTQQYRDQLKKVNEQIDAIASEQFADDIDFSEIDAMIADPGMEINADEILAMDVDELYDVARELEQEIAQDYAAIRAAELSAIQQSDFEQSFEQIAQNLPQREDFDFDAMGENLETLGDVGEYRDELETVGQEVQKMWQNAQNMQGQAQGFQRMGQQGQQGKQGQAKAQMQAQQAMNNAAQMQTGRSVMVDMSQQMRMSYAMGGGGGDTLADPERLRDTETGLIAEGRIQKKHIQINQHKVKAEAMPGRKFTDSSSRKGWLYVDTWYVIGPWQAEFKGGKIDWKTIHPPEYEIDLSKEYIGKKNKTLRWNFTQSNTLRTTPPDEQSNSTYYAYTEVHFDKAQDMLLAIASDDAAKVWVNDMLVWQDNGLSAWSLDEGFRKVAFKEGFNKILVRIANGPVVCQYSVLLCPPDLR